MKVSIFILTMSASGKKGLEISGNQKIGFDPIPNTQISIGNVLDLGIVNQYGQLIGEYSRLDEELWLPDHEDEEEAAAVDVLNRINEEGQKCHLLPSIYKRWALFLSAVHLGKKMDPNNPNYSQNFDDFDPSFCNHPQFQLFMQRMGRNPNNFFQNPASSFPNPQQQTPPQNTTLANYQSFAPQPSQDYEHSPHVYQGSNINFDDVEDEAENVPETPQYSPEPIMSHPLPVNPSQQVEVQPSTRWNSREDEALIASYMEHCTDAVIGTNQKGVDLWRKVQASYDAAQKCRPHELPKRNLKMLENRWRRMAADVMLFVGCFEEASKIIGSGYNDADVVQNARKLFRSSTNPPRNFLCEHAWRMITDYPKWRKKIRWGISKKERDAVDAEKDREDSSGSGKRTRLDADGDTVIASGSASHVSGGIPRPDGVKKAKAKRSGKGVASEGAMSISEQMKAQSELRQRKLEFDKEKERRKQKQLQLEEMKMKFDMLQTLMSKESLTPGEEALKDKLLREIYGNN